MFNCFKSAYPKVYYYNNNNSNKDFLYDTCTLCRVVKAPRKNNPLDTDTKTIKEIYKKMS